MEDSLTPISNKGVTGLEGTSQRERTSVTNDCLGKGGLGGAVGKRSNQLHDLFSGERADEVGKCLLGGDSRHGGVVHGGVAGLNEKVGCFVEKLKELLGGGGFVEEVDKEGALVS